jgi:hypothetical protein
MTASLFSPLPSVGEMVSWSRELQAHPDEDQIPGLSQSQVSEVALAGERRLCPDSRGGYAGVLQVCMQATPSPGDQDGIWRLNSRRRLSCRRDVCSPGFWISLRRLLGGMGPEMAEGSNGSVARPRPIHSWPRRDGGRLMLRSDVLRVNPFVAKEETCGRDGRGNYAPTIQRAIQSTSPC